MQKIRLRYAKRGVLRFTSHRDVARAFERAVRRAGLPIAHSYGFNPHPKLSWIGAAPTGVASEAEYVELQLIRQVDPAQVAEALRTALPPGLAVLDALAAAGGSLAERIEASRWRIELPGVPPEELRAAVRALLAASTVEVRRLTKQGMRTMDARPAIVSAEVHTSDQRGEDTAVDRSVEVSRPNQPYGILVVVVRQTTPAVRPDDVMSALHVVAELEPPVPAKATRMAQGRLDDGGGLSDPLAPDRAAVSGQALGNQEPRPDGVD